MSGFNKNSRTKNVLLTSSIGLICTLINTILGFGYRTFFIRVLSPQYLGISGLFTNILDLLSLANLGIMTSISYRMYKPIAEGDSEKVGQLMRFTRYVYYFVAGFIFIVGASLMPFLEFFIKDTSEIPSDVNLHVAYFIYLLQMVSSYLYTYKLNILIADQRKYEHSIIQTILTVVKYLSQVIVLVTTHNFMWTITIGIFSTILTNVVFSIVVSKQYKEVFQTKTSLSKEERHNIFKDCYATMCHKIGYTVINSTDSLLVSKFIGLTITGMYSNYTLLTGSLKKILEPILSNVTASIGNAHVTEDEDTRYAIYRRLLFMNLFISSYTTYCMYILIDSFITIWVGKDMLLDSYTVGVLCMQFYLQTAHIINESYINASGLFNKDKIRPVIEAALNIVISIALVYPMGLAGIFVGTVISHMLTVFWREPLNLYRYEFKTKSENDFWLTYIGFGILTVVMIILTKQVITHTSAVTATSSWLTWLSSGILCTFAYFAVTWLLLHKKEEYQYFYHFILGKLKVIKIGK